MSSRIVVAAFAALTLPSVSRAQPAIAAHGSTLQQLIDQALERNPELAAARQSVMAAQTRPAQAGSRPGPMFGLQYTNDGWSPSLGSEDMTTLAVMASQELPYAGKRRLRRAVAEADAGLAEWNVERVRLSLVSSVKRAYYGIVLARGLANLAAEHRDLSREVEETARVRYAAAIGQQQELLRAQVEATRVNALHAQHHAEARARLAELNRLLVRAAGTDVDTPDTVPLTDRIGSLEGLLEQADSLSPELKGAAAAVARDELAVSLATKGFRPDFVVQAAYMNRGGLPPMWQAGASIALPSRAAARAAVAEADARLAASRSRVEDVRLRLRAAVEQRHAFLTATEEIEATYRDGMLPQGRTAVESALARYRAGQGSQLSVLEAVVALVEDRTDYLRLLVGHASERARLEEASLDPPAMDGLLPHGRTGMGAGASPMDRGGMRAAAPPASAPEMR
jgi:outer membrane protein, heavy metal efflux system